MDSKQIALLVAVIGVTSLLLGQTQFNNSQPSGSN